MRAQVHERKLPRSPLLALVEITEAQARHNLVEQWDREVIELRVANAALCLRNANTSASLAGAAARSAVESRDRPRLGASPVLTSKLAQIYARIATLHEEQDGIALRRQQRENEFRRETAQAISRELVLNQVAKQAVSLSNAHPKDKELIQLRVLQMEEEREVCAIIRCARGRLPQLGRQTHRRD